jgi:hypothetical protein
MSWHRIRRRVKGQPDPELYEQKKRELKELEKQEKEGKIDLYFRFTPYKKLWEKQKEWEQKGLKIFFLPTYSPQLNKIEILWRFIKYEWLRPSAYGSYLSLVKAVEGVKPRYVRNETFILKFHNFS